MNKLVKIGDSLASFTRVNVMTWCFLRVLQVGQQSVPALVLLVDSDDGRFTFLVAIYEE